MHDAERQNFLAARDFLLRHRTDYATAVRGFSWPALSRFNWALDYFDDMARGNADVALWIVQEDGSEQKCSLDQLSRRSNQIANFFLDKGFRAGDCAMMMLGNEVALWETMLACMKIGVVLIPVTPLLTARDLQERIERGAIRHVIIGESECAKFEALNGAFTRIAVGFSRPGWTSFEAGYAAWFKNGNFRVTQASGILPSEQWNFDVTGVDPGGLRPPGVQARCG